MMKAGHCPKCSGGRIGHLASLPDTVGSETEVARRHLGIAITDGAPIGALEAYVCASCGYLELSVADPDKVCFDIIRGFSWVTAPPTPYR